MTVQEAIKKLRLLNEIIGNNPNVLAVPYSKEELFGFKQGLSLAIKALCNNAVKTFCDAHEYHYCLHCGQRIDWSDEE